MKRPAEIAYGPLLEMNSDRDIRGCKVSLSVVVCAAVHVTVSTPLVGEVIEGVTPYGVPPYWSMMSTWYPVTLDQEIGLPFASLRAMLNERVAGLPATPW